MSIIQGPKISIITACYNAVNTIEQTIRSVIDQHYNNIEYIIVDGASNDGSMDIVRKYEHRLNIVVSEPDRGIYDAFNKGAKLATGDYIQYLNADDYLMDHGVIQEVGEFIRDHNEPVLLYGGILKTNEDTGHVMVLNKHISYEDIQNGQMIPHPATFVRRSVLLEIGLFDTNYQIAADYDFVCKVYNRYRERILYFPKLITHFRMGGISNNIKTKELVHQEIIRVLQDNFSRVPARLPDISNEALLKIWLRKMVFEGKSIGDFLLKENIKSVAIWGTGELAVLLFKEFQNAGIETLFYIDNDQQKQSLHMNGIPIVSPDYFIENHTEIDCMIMGFEGKHEASVFKQIESYSRSPNLPIYSWRDLVKEL